MRAVLAGFAARRWPLAILAIVLGTGILSCTDHSKPEPLGPETGTEPVSLALRPTFSTLAGTQTLPVNHVRIRAVDEATGALLSASAQDVDPNAPEWRLSFTMQVPRGQTVSARVTAELINRNGTVEVVEWSGRSDLLRLNPGDIKMVEFVFHRGPPTNLTITRLKINQPIPPVLEGDTLRLGVTVEGATGSPRLFWSSLDTTIAVVDASGLVRGRTPGNVRVAVTAGPKADTAVVTVLPRVARIVVTPDSAQAAALGDEVTYTARAFDARGVGVDGVTMAWRAGDPTVAESLGGGRFRAARNGRTEVIATSEQAPGAEGRAVFVVRQRVARVEVLPATAAARALGVKQQFGVIVTDGSGRAVMGRPVTWSSSRPGVAPVDSTGMATATANGSTQITATVDGISGTAEYSVAQEVATITLSPATATLGAVGATQAFTAVARDANGHVVEGRPFTWTSSAAAVAGVSGTGVATAAGNGTTTITASIDGISGSAVLTVSQSIARIEIRGEDGPLTSLGATRQLRAVAFDGNGNEVRGLSFAWSSAPSTVAGVDSTGLVTALTPGTTTITVTGGGMTATRTITVTQVPAAVLKDGGDGQSGTGGAPLPTPLRAKVVDAGGNAIPGVTVTWSVATGGGSFAPASATTGAAGTVEGSWTLGTTPGANTLTASVGSLSTTFSATAMAGAAARIIKESTDGESLGVGSTKVLRVKVVDAAGNPVAGYTISWAAANGSVSAASTATDADGYASVTWTLGTAAGAQTVTASAGNLTGSPVTYGVTGIPGPASAATSLISANPGSITADGIATSTVTVRLRDQYGNDVPSGAGQTVALATTAGMLGAVANNGDGTFTATLTAPTVAGMATISGTLNGTAMANTASVTLTPIPGVQYVVTPSSLIPAAGTTITVTAQLADASGNPVAVAGRTVTWSSTGGGAFSAATSTTNAAGQATVSFTVATVAGTLHRVTATDNTGLSGTSAEIRVQVGAPNALQIVAGDNQSATAGSAVAVAPSVRVVDAQGNGVPDVPVTFAPASGGGSVTGAMQISSSTGQATVGSWTLGTLVGANTLSASVAGITPVTFTATGAVGAAATLSKESGDGGTATVATTRTLEAKVVDGNGNPVSGHTVAWAVSVGGGSLSAATSTTSASGIASITWTFGTTAGSQSVTATSAGLSGSPLIYTVSTTPDAAAKLSISTQPSSTAQSGVAFGTQPAVQLQDQYGNAVSQAGVGVTVAIASGGGALGGTATANTDASGVATFAGLSITGTVGIRTLGFSAPGLTGATSGNVNVGAGAASQLAIAVQPSNATAGASIAPAVEVTIQDASGNTVTSATDNVIVVIGTNPSSGTLSGTATVAAVNGVATFSNLSIDKVGAGYTLAASSGSLTGATSSAFNITPGAAAQLAITTQPSSTAQSGVTFGQQPVIQLQDAFGNTVPQAGVSITTAIASGGGSLGGTATVNTDAAGQVTFTDLSITGTVGTRTLSFSAGGLTGATSNNINLTAGAASQLAITTQPSSTAQSGVAFAQQPVIQLQDASGNAVSQAGVSITTAITSGGGALDGTASVNTDASGQASFTGLSITGTIGNRTLGFSSAGLTGATSNTINITAGAASQLVFTAQPSNTAAGASIAPAVEVTIRDASGNTVTSATDNVTLAIGTNAGSGTLSGTATVAAVSGVATFSNLSIDKVGTGYTLAASSGSLTGATSSAFNITPGAATQLAITTQPSATAQSGVAFGQQPVVQLRDAHGNAVSQSGVSITTAIASGGGTLGGTATVNTDASGAATFTNLSITGTIGIRTLSFSSVGLTGATSNTINLTAGAASQLAISTQPSSTAQSGVAFAQQPVIQLQDASGNAVSQAGVSITTAIASGGGALGGTASVNTDATGQVTFTDLSITGTIGIRTLSFSSAGLTGVTSSNINITAGAASQLAITTQPSSTAQSGVAFAQQPVIQLQDASGNAVSQAGVSITTAIASGGGTLGGTATVNTDASGAAMFTDLAITGTIGNRTLSFSAGGLTAATSSNINITAGAASQLAITMQPSSTAQSGVAFAQQPVIQLQDASGNAVSQAGVSITAAIASGGGTLGGTASVNTDASGQASFTGLSITGTIGNRTLSFSSVGLTGATSNSINITAGAASQLAISTQPSSTAQSGVAFAQQPVIQLQDASGNAVSQAGVSITTAIASGGGTLGGTATVNTDASGQASFAGLSITGTVGNRTLSFSSLGLTSATSNSINITAGAASQLAISTQPSSTAQSGVAFAQQPVIQLQDASGNAVSQAGVSITTAIASGGGTLGGTATVNTDASGQASFAGLSITGTVGNRTLSFSSAGLTGATSNNINITAGAASQLAITVQPSNTAAGASITPAVQVTIQDASGNTVISATDNVTFAIGTNPSSGTLSGTATVAAVNGVATFSNLSIDKVGTGYTLAASSGSLTGATSSTFNITPGAASQVVFTVQPSNTAAGSSITPAVQVTIRDAFGNTVTSATDNVTVAVGTNPASGALSGTATVAAVNGVATFSNLSIDKVGTGYTLAASSGSLTGATSNGFNITPGAATQLSITTQPSSTAQSGAAFAQQPVVQLRDAHGNAVSQAGVSITTAIASGGGSLGGTATVNTDASGAATFTNLSITGTIGIRTLSFSSAGLTGATSNNINITAGAASQLAISTQPSSTAQSGVGFAQQPVVQLQDASGNAVSQAGVSITTAIASGGGTLGGTASVNTDASGQASFTGLSITGTIGNRTLSFTSVGLTGATSNNINITAGAASQVAFTVQPSNAAAGASIAPAVEVTIRDASGNTVTSATDNVTLAIGTNPGGGTLSGTATVAAVNGVATFSNLSIDKVGTGYTLAASSGSLTGATSSTFNITPGAATQLAISTQPSSTAQSGVAFAQQPVIQLQDAFGNAVSQSGVSITAAIASGGGTLGGTATVNTDASGQASFAGLSITGMIGNRTLSFSSAGLTGVTSGNVNITAGAASQLAISTQPSSTAQSGVGFAQQPVVQLQDASGNAVAQAGVSITTAIASGGGTLGGTASVNTDASGQATFTNLYITGTIGIRTLSFSSLGLTGATSNNISITAGAASQVAFTVQPSNAAAGASIAPAVEVTIRDASGNTVTGATDNVTVAIGTNPGSGTLSGTATVAAVNGVATFSNLSINKVGTGYTLAASSGSLTGATSSAFNITPGAATQLSISTQPSSSAQSGAAFAQQPVVQLRDAHGNAVSQSGVSITTAIASGGGTLGGTATVNTDASGAATFTNLSITGTIGIRTLSFSSVGLTGATSNNINLTAGAASQLAISTQPSSTAQSGVALGQQPVIQLQDASGNAVSQAGVSITTAIASGGGTLGGTASVTTDASGVATFTNLSITGTIGIRTLSFSSVGLTGATSNNINITAGAASQLAISTQPSSTAQSGVAFGQQPVIQLQDASGNAVSQNGVSITAAIASGGGTLGGTASVSTDASGQASFTGLSITGTIGNRTLSFSSAGLTGVTSGNVNITAGAASQLAISTQPSSTAQSGVGFAQQPVVQLQDASGNAVSQAGVSITTAIASGGGTLGGTASVNTDASGQATFAGLSITGTIGIRTLSFSSAGLTGATSNNINITAGAASQLAISMQPSSTAQSGVAFAQQPVIQLQDASGNAVSQNGVSITTAIASGGGTLGGTASVNTDVNGQASFTGLSITGTIGNRTLSFSSAGLTGATSNTISITAGAASQVAFTVQPSNTAAGASITPAVQVTIRDASGNTVTSATDNVTLAIGTNPGNGTLSGTATVAAVNGVATFSNLSIDKVGTGYTLAASSGSLTGATSGTFNITPGAAAQLSITAQPSSTAQSGVAFGQQPVIQLQDAFGNAVSQSGVSITAAIASGGGALGGTASVNTDAAGQATFTDLSIAGTVGTRKLSFSAGGLTGATSSNINITAGAASQLAITTQPSSTAQSGVAFAQQPVIQLQDASGNAVSQAGVSITTAIASGGGTLGGTATVNTDASGAATFTNLSISGTIGNRTLSFSASGLTGATSGNISITAGPASQLAISTQPSSTAQSGVAFAQQPVIQLQDASGNAVSQNGVSITTAIASGGGTLGGTATVNTDASGQASFAGLSITGTIGNRTLSFSSAGLTGATSNTISITAAGATQLSITTQPSSTAQSGVAFAQQPVIQLRDGSGNAVSQSGVEVTAAIASGGGSLGGTATATTNASGVATFTNLSISGTIGIRTLSFSASGLTGATSGNINLTAGAASQLAISTQPSSTAQSGVAFGQQPVIQLQDASGNAVSQAGVSITTAIASGGGALGGTATVNTDASGQASFTGLSITGTIGNRTLSFSSVGLTGATSNTINITAGAASQVAFTVQPSNTAAGASITPAVEVTIRDASGNAVTSATDNVTLAIGTNAGSGTLSGTSTTAAVNGVATFSNLSIDKVGTGYTLTASSGSLTGATSSTFNITPGVATQLSITTQPSSSAQSGAAFAQQPVVQLRDAHGNAVSQGGVQITTAIASGGGTLGGTASVNTDANGQAAFSDLSITGTAGNRTLSFSASGLTGATSNTISITAAGATQLSITTQPSSTAQSGVAFAQQPVVQLRDGSGNAVSQSGVEITAAIASGGGSLGGTATATTDASGVATFTNLSISGTIGTRTLSFSATGLTGATSGNINLTAGAASQLAISTQPSSTAQSGVAFGTQPVIQLQDASGNAVSQAGVSITTAIASGGGTLGGTASVNTDVNGQASFTGLSITGTIGNRTLSFSSAGLTGATSNTISITAGAASQLVFTAQPSNTAAGASITPAVEVTIRDASGNTVTSATDNVTVAIGTNAGSGTLSGTATVAAMNGVATFSNLSIDKVGAGYMLAASSGSLTGATSSTFNITPGAATQLSITTQPSSSAQSGVAFAQQPVVQLRDAHGNSVSQAGVSITTAIASGGGSLGGTATVNTDASGVATFTNLSITGTVGTRTLSFSAAGLTGATSGNINLTAGAASQLVISTQPSSTAQSGVAFAQQPVIQLQDASGNAVSQNGVSITTAIASGGGTLGGTASVNTDVNGQASFTGLSITGTIGNRTLSFSSAGLTGATSNTISITAGAASQVAFTMQPSNTAAGASITPAVQVTIRDASGNTVTSATDNVTLAIGTNPGSGTLSGTVTVAAVNGVATFSNLSINKVGTGYTLAASSGSLSGATSSTFDITPGALSTFVVEAQGGGNIGTQTAGVAFNVSLTAKDANGNTVTSFTGTADVSSTGTLSAGSGTTAAFTNGVLASHGVTISNAGTFTLTATRTGSTEAGTSNSFTVNAGAPTVTAMSPISGPTAGGTVVTITGTNLSGATSVTFGGTAGTITGTTATTVTVTTPARAAGAYPVVVTTPGGTASPSSNFTYQNAPTITSFTPTRIPLAGDMPVTITGTNLVGATSVTIGGTAATITANTATSITVTPPARTAGTYAIQVTTTSGTATSASNISYEAAKYIVTSSNPNPAVSETVTMTAQLAFSSDNTSIPLSGKTVTWSVVTTENTGGSFAGGGQTATSTTNASGVATITFTVSSVGGEFHTITATDNASPSRTGTAAPMETGVSLVGASPPVSGNAQNETTLTLTAPSGLRSGDILIAVISLRTNNAATTALTPPAGWTLLRRDHTANAQVSQAVFYRWADAADSSQPFTWAFSGTRTNGYILGYRNVDPTIPFQTGNALAAVNTADVSTTTLTAPAISPSTVNTRVVHMFNVDFGGVTWVGYTAGLAEIYRSATVTGGGVVQFAGAHQTLRVTGSTGTRTATTSGGGAGSGAFVAHSIGLKHKP